MADPHFFAAGPLKLSIASAGAAEVSRQRFSANFAQTHSRTLARGSLGMLLGCGNIAAAGSESLDFVGALAELAPLLGFLCLILDRPSKCPGLLPPLCCSRRELRYQQSVSMQSIESLSSPRANQERTRLILDDFAVGAVRLACWHRERSWTEVG
jgi:hypothetical protein